MTTSHDTIRAILDAQQRRQAARLDTIHHCDALTLMRALPDDSIDMILTSPPYDDLRIYNGYSFPFEPIANELVRILKHGGVLVWVVGDKTENGSESLSSFRQVLYFNSCGLNLYDTMIYEKDRTLPQRPIVRFSQVFEYMFVLSKGIPKTLNIPITKKENPERSKASTRRDKKGRLKKFSGEYISLGVPERNIWYIPGGWMKTTTDKKAYDHPAMFPEKLASRHIKAWSSPGDVVCDPFTGSGTTCKMARNLGRHYIGCDISAEYVAIARERLAQPYTPDMFEQPPAPPAAQQHALNFGD